MIACWDRDTVVAPTFEVAREKNSPVATVKSHVKSKQIVCTPRVVKFCGNNAVQFK